MKKEQFEFIGENNFKLPAVIWLPDNEPKMVVQIVHGMTEHMGRYENFAKVLTEAGIGVAGFDLRGHGKNDIGMSCASFGEEGWQMTLKEIHKFHESLKNRFENASHILFGFSLGAFLAREYFSITENHGFAGAIIMGTGSQPRWVLSLIMKIVKKEIKKVGFDYTNAVVRQLSFGTYNKNFSPNRTYVDWLCSDEEQVDKYIDDELCKEDISSGLFYQLLESMRYTARRDTYNNWNKDMPVLLISGSDDPVGNKGKGVKLVEKSMLSNGLKNVTCKLYKNGRHDILHEEKQGIAKLVCCDIKDWMMESIIKN